MSEGMPTPPSSRPTTPECEPKILVTDNKGLDTALEAMEMTSATEAEMMMDDDDELSDIIVDAQPRFSAPRTGSGSGHPVVPPKSHRPEHALSDAAASTLPVEPGMEEPPKPPARLLDDEQSHVQKPGSGNVTLRDFEVQGTLGKFIFRILGCFRHRCLPHSSYSGTGTFGRVLLVRLKSSVARGSQNFFALKVLRKTEIVKLRQVEHVNAERYILSRTRHPFVVDLYATFQDSMNIYMLLSYVPGGELFTHLRRARRFSPDVARFYLATIVLALRYLHSFNIIYRDLKPENLLLDARGYLRLTDFGFSKIVDDRTWTLCGTPEYLAPEIVLSEGHGKAADWWACGVLAYEMMVGYPPFFDATPFGIYHKIVHAEVIWPPGIDAASRSFVDALLVKDKSKRLGNMNGGPQDVLNHTWFRGVDWDALERREIRAPIVPQVTSHGDMRHFLHLPHPPAEEIPGLLRDERPPSLHERFDPVAYQFMEF
jgi:hypothetical protein